MNVDFFFFNSSHNYRNTSGKKEEENGLQYNQVIRASLPPLSTRGNIWFLHSISYLTVRHVLLTSDSFRLVHHIWSEHFYTWHKEHLPVAVTDRARVWIMSGRGPTLVFTTIILFHSTNKIAEN